MIFSSPPPQFAQVCMSMSKARLRDQDHAEVSTATVPPSQSSADSIPLPMLRRTSAGRSFTPTLAINRLW